MYISAVVERMLMKIWNPEQRESAWQMMATAVQLGRRR